MRALWVHTKHPFQPARGREAGEIRRRMLVSTLAAKRRVDASRTIVRVNTDWVPLSQWRRTLIADGDLVQFVAIPQGGEGSNPLAALLAIAVLVFAPPVGAAIAGALGITSAAGIALAQAGVALVGTALVNMLVPPPRAPSHLATPGASPTYSLTAQGNLARLEAAIPVWYGRNLIYPDFAAEPYTEFRGNQQYLYQLLCVGQGYYDFEAIRIEDTALSSFPEATYEVVEPGQSVTLFPTNVVTSVEVSGQEALYNVYLGPFVANASGTQANAIAIDWTLPKGLFYANDEGGLDARSVTFLVEYREIDDLGDPIGSWVQLFSKTLTFATATPQRGSQRTNVTPGRYEVRLVRTTPKDTDARAGNDLQWVGLRAYLPGSQQYGDLTLIAMRLRASNSLSQLSSRRVNVIATRKLPSWHPSTGWSALAASRSIAWALADICRADYGADLADTRYALQELYDLEQVWAARGDKFDGGFDNRTTVAEALTLAARAGRAKWYIQGGQIHFVRDQPASLPVAMFTERNIVRGSLEVDYVLPTEATADSVQVTYRNATTWREDRVTATLPGGTTLKPAKLSLFGVVERAQAWREGMYMAAANRYRRMPIVLRTELEGLIPTFGDLVALSYVRIRRGQAGELVSCTGINGSGGIDNGGIVGTSEELVFGAGQHYLSFRKRDGSMSGPWMVGPGADANHCVLQQAVTGFQPYLGQAEERTHYTFGVGADQYLLARVVAIRPRGSQVELHLVNEDAAVHTADQGTVPGANPTWSLPGKIVSPVVTGLTVAVQWSGEVPILHLSWDPAAGADHYLVERSDDGTVWTRVGDPSEANIAFPVQRVQTWVRVAGVGLVRGEWVTWDGNPDTMTAPPPDVSGLALVEAFTGTTLKVKCDAMARTDYYSWEVHAGSPLTLRRTTLTLVPVFSYTGEEARVDGGPWRAITIKVKGVNGGGQSANYATIAPTNPPPAALSGVQIFAARNAAVLTYTKPSDTDFAGVLVKYSQSSGFDPEAAGTLGYDGPDAHPTVQGLDVGVTYYFRIAAYDTFGSTGLNWAAEVSLTASASATAAEILDSLEASLTNPATLGDDGTLVLNAERFAIRKRGYAALSDIDHGAALTVDANVALHDSTGGDWGTARATIPRSSGKWYWEITANDAPGLQSVGIATAQANVDGNLGADVYGWSWTVNGAASNKLHNGSAASYGTAWGDADVISVVLDLDAGTIEFWLDGVSQGVAYTGLSGMFFPAVALQSADQSLSANFGAQPFVHAPPAGYKGYENDPTDSYPFIFGTVNGQDYIAISADVLINGSVAIENLRTGALPGDVQLKLGGGTIVLDGQGLIDIFAGLGANQNFLRLSAARLAFWRYVTGIGYVEYNTLRRREQGVVQSGETFTLPGYWSSQPYVQVSPKSLQLYDKDFATQDQTITCDATNVEEVTPGSGQYRFTAVATLSLASSSGNVVVNVGSGDISANTWTSDSYITPANCTSITPSVSLQSKRGNGASQWYYRSIRWRVEVWNGASWDAQAWRTKAMGAQFNPVTDSGEHTFPSAGTWTWRLYFEAFDTDGSVFGAVSYDFSVENIAQVVQEVDANLQWSWPQSVGVKSLTQTITLAASTLNPTWEIYQIDYAYQWAWEDYDTDFFITLREDHSGKHRIVANASNVLREVSWSVGTNWASRNYLGAGGTGKAGNIATWNTVALGASGGRITGSSLTYNRQVKAYAEYTVHSSDNGVPQTWVRTKLRNPSAKIYRRNPQANSTTPTNNFLVQNYGYQLSGAQVLATGALNYLAVGD